MQERWRRLSPVGKAAVVVVGVLVVLAISRAGGGAPRSPSSSVAAATAGPGASVAQVASAAATPPPQAAVDWNGVIAEAQAQWEGIVLGGRYEDNFLIINVNARMNEAGATNLACETVKPILERRGVPTQQFAIYRPNGDVLATGGRCP